MAQASNPKPLTANLPMLIMSDQDWPRFRDRLQHVDKQLMKSYAQQVSACIDLATQPGREAIYFAPQARGVSHDQTRC